MSFTPTQEAQLLQLLAKQAELLSLADNQVEIISELGAGSETIPDLTVATSLADVDLLVLRQGTEDKSVSGAVLKAAAQSGAVLTTGAQTIADVKTFSSSPVVPNATTAQQAAAFGQIASAFTGSNVSLSANGHQKLPSGLIIQWGSGYNNSTGKVTWTYPIAFPNAAFFAIAVIGANAPTDFTDRSCTTVELGTTSYIFNLTQNGAADTRGAASNWKLFAIGY